MTLYPMISYGEVLVAKRWIAACRDCLLLIGKQSIRKRNRAKVADFISQPSRYRIVAPRTWGPIQHAANEMP